MDLNCSKCKCIDQCHEKNVTLLEVGDSSVSVDSIFKAVILIFSGDGVLGVIAL